MKLSRAILPVILALASLTFADSKPKLTLDEFFNSVSYTSVAISPDGTAVVIAVERADWDQQIFRTDLWLYRDDAKGGSLHQLTQSGHDIDPQWSPDGRWITFLSERKSASEKDSDSSVDKKEDKETSQIYLISPSGGEAIQITQGEEEVHTFSWSSDSRTIYFATRQPWTKVQQDDYEKQWKDIVEYRTAERGDAVFALDLATALARHSRTDATAKTDTENQSNLTPAARTLATLPLRIDEMVTAPDGTKLAILSNAINQREEKYEDVEIYLLDLADGTRPLSPTTAGAAHNPSAEPRRLTHNLAVEIKLHWANDSRHMFFSLEEGDISAGPYHDVQPHLYWIDTDAAMIEQWSTDFIGTIEHYTVAADSVIAAARLGTEVALYSVAHSDQPLHKLSGWQGTYATLAAAAHSPRLAFIYSSLQKPAEVYLAESSDKLAQARPITSFNKLFTERELAQGKPYRWKADDGTTIEGMLIYPPGSFDVKASATKRLPMFTYIHGGPNDADGDHFEADWYVWGQLAATNGWLVFEPNYRGSTGYGDKFLRQIVPEMVSRPGKDILEGIDALVKAGIADPAHLTIGGYSYGGFLTNWLITQTTRFKAAVTGAGAVEYVANWGNDDTSFDDAYFLGGRPWEVPQRYQSEAPIYQIDKVKTPTHIVAGADDDRVAVLEAYLLEHALYSLGVPNKLLIFPGEGHSLYKNPWHGKIKVREELKWLQKYGGVPAGN